MTSLKKLSAVLALTLPLAAAAQPAAETPPAAPPAVAPAPAEPPPAPAKPAAAPAKPLFTLYGTLNANVQNDQAYSTTGATQQVRPRQAVSLDSSNIGVRGAADVSHGLSVVYQCETSAKLDGIANASLCDRNSRVGLTGAYGTLFVGNWDSPFKAAYYGTKADDPFGNTDTYGANDIMGSPGFRVVSGGNITAIGQATGVAGFDIRAANSVAYHSPKFMGLSAKLQTSVNEFANKLVTTTPYLWSAVVNYDEGPISVFAAWERHDDYFGLNVLNPTPPATNNGVGHNSVDWAYRVGAGIELPSPFGATTISGVFEQLYYEQEHATEATALKKADRPAFMVSAKHRMGNHEFRARYNNADQGSATAVGGAKVDTSGLGAQQYTVGYAYYFAKSTQVYAFYTRLENERNAAYTLGAGGGASGDPAIVGALTPLGATLESFGLGMRYAF